MPDRDAWAGPGPQDLGGGVYRIPLPLPSNALRAVNVYALADAGGVDLIDSGMALVQARDQLTAALADIGYQLGDVRNFLITHMHHDHYTLAADLRRTLRSGPAESARQQGMISLGEQERENLRAARELASGHGGDGFLASLRRLGAMDLGPGLAAANGRAALGPDVWTDPDRWLSDGTDLDLRSRTLRAVHTPGHTSGHLVYHDAAAGLMFAGDHVLPHITPSIGFEPAPNPMALRDYLGSLARILALPDARLLPAHGAVAESTHARVEELLAHHETRLAQTYDAVRAGEATAYEAAKAITWTRRLRQFADLDTLSQFLAANETGAHLEVLVLRGQANQAARRRRRRPVPGPVSPPVPA